MNSWCNKITNIFSKIKQGKRNNRQNLEVWDFIDMSGDTMKVALDRLIDQIHPISYESDMKSTSNIHFLVVFLMG